jgi:hypothetical protein
MSKYMPNSLNRIQFIESAIVPMQLENGGLKCKRVNVSFDINQHNMSRPHDVNVKLGHMENSLK